MDKEIEKKGKRVKGKTGKTICKQSAERWIALMKKRKRKRVKGKKRKKGKRGKG